MFLLPAPGAPQALAAEGVSALDAPSLAGRDEEDDREAWAALRATLDERSAGKQCVGELLGCAGASWCVVLFPPTT